MTKHGCTCGQVWWTDNPGESGGRYCPDCGGKQLPDGSCGPSAEERSNDVGQELLDHMGYDTWEECAEALAAEHSVKRLKDIMLDALAGHTTDDIMDID